MTDLPHLPAYVALARLFKGRRVVVVEPEDLAGARALRDGGAKATYVIAESLAGDDEFPVRAGVPKLPLKNASVDAVVCLEHFVHFDAATRTTLIAEAFRALRPGGVFAAWLPADAAALASDLDYWGLSDAVSQHFGATTMWSQMPWAGYSLAPVKEEGPEPGTVLADGLLETPPEATHYLAIGRKGGAQPQDSSHCVLVPTAAGPSGGSAQRTEELVAQVERAESDAEEAWAQVDQLRDALSGAQHELASIRGELSERTASSEEERRKVDDLEQSATSFRERVRDLEAATAAEQARVDALSSARDEARRRAETLENELEGQRSAVSKARETIADLQARLSERQERDVKERVDAQRLEVERDALAQQLEQAAARAEEAEALARTRQTDVTVLTRTVSEQEKALARLSERVESQARELEGRGEQGKELESRAAEALAQREEIARQLEVALAEREGARQLAARVEADLDLARKRMTAMEQSLAERISEASRLGGELEVTKDRLAAHEREREQLQSRAEELSASAAAGQEHGRALAEVALDRDRMREELARRSTRLEEIEQKLWEAHDGLQSERVEKVRIAGEVASLQEQLERTRSIERGQQEELQRLASELREREVAATEHAGRLRARELELERLKKDLEALSSDSDGARDLQNELQERAQQMAELTAEVERLRAQHDAAERLVGEHAAGRDKLENEVDALRAELRNANERGQRAQQEAEVRQVRLTQFEGDVERLHDELQEARTRRTALESQAGDLQRKVEEAAASERMLREQLKQRESDVERLAAKERAQQSELARLQADLEAATAQNGELEDALRQDPNASGEYSSRSAGEVKRLRGELSDLRAALARAESEARATDQHKAQRTSLEAQVRSAEQEQMLALIDAHEQTIWEMTDAADRNAARLAAGLANIEKHKEKLDETQSDLDAARKEAADLQAQLRDRERDLAGERAKLARVGLGGSTFDREAALGALNPESNPLMDLDEGDEAPAPGPAAAGVPQVVVNDRTGSGSARGRSGGIVVEEIDDDEWPEEGHDEEAAAEAPPQTTATTMPDKTPAAVAPGGPSSATPAGAPKTTVTPPKAGAPTAGNLPPVAVPAEVSQDARAKVPVGKATPTPAVTPTPTPAATPTPTPAATPTPKAGTTPRATAPPSVQPSAPAAPSVAVPPVTVPLAGAKTVARMNLVRRPSSTSLPSAGGYGPGKPPTAKSKPDEKSATEKSATEEPTAELLDDDDEL